MSFFYVSVSIAIELALLTFHVSVSVFLFAMVRKRRHPFTSGFFALYLTQSVVDCASYAVVSTLEPVTVFHVSVSF